MFFFKFAFFLFFLSPNLLFAQELTTVEKNPILDNHSVSYFGFIEKLTINGFSITLIEKTLLNRVRIISIKDNLTRETIISTSTNLILRDSVWTD
jgi:hypothetical protein